MPESGTDNESSTTSNRTSNNADITIQKEYIALTDIQEFDKEQCLWSGHILPQQQKHLPNSSDRDVIYFSRDYNPDVNDMDKVFKEIEFDDSLAGIPFTMVPFNKVRLFYVPESIIQIVQQSGQANTIKI